MCEGQDGLSKLVKYLIVCLRNLFPKQDDKLGKLCWTGFGQTSKYLYAPCGFSSAHPQISTESKMLFKHLGFQSLTLCPYPNISKRLCPYQWGPVGTCCWSHKGTEWSPWTGASWSCHQF